MQQSGSAVMPLLYSNRSAVMATFEPHSVFCPIVGRQSSKGKMDTAVAYLDYSNAEAVF